MTTVDTKAETDTIRTSFWAALLTIVCNVIGSAITTLIPIQRIGFILYCAQKLVVHRLYHDRVCQIAWTALEAEPSRHVCMS